jgi:hypothetical protein
LIDFQLQMVELFGYHSELIKLVLMCTGKTDFAVIVDQIFRLFSVILELTSGLVIKMNATVLTTFRLIDPALIHTLKNCIDIT